MHTKHSMRATLVLALVVVVSLCNGYHASSFKHTISMKVLSASSSPSFSAAVDFASANKATTSNLQMWYNTKNGLWNTTLKWCSANVLSALIDFSMYQKNNTYLSVIQNTFNTNQVFNDEGVDDEGWWGLAWNRAYKLTGDARYLHLAEAVFADMATYWDSKCGGGVWWDRARTYKNAITNELFFSLAGALYLSTNNQTYLKWALQEWQWFESSSMINPQYLINDGINTGTCKNNGQTTWTYNQGVVLGGLVNLYTATKNSTLLDVAMKIASAAMSGLVYNGGILREPCEPSKNCDGDQIQFKGLFIRNAGYLYQATKNANLGNFILNNANSIYQNNRTPNNFMGLYWVGPVDNTDAGRQSAACECFNAATLVQQA